MGVQERREREREARKSTILDAARELFLEHGFNGTTTKQIAAKCELSEATLFFYFQSKNEIFTSLLFEGIDFWTQGLKKIDAIKMKPRAKLEELWNFYDQIREEHPEYYQLSAFLARPMALSNVSEEMKAEIIRRSGENFQIQADMLDEIVGNSEGRIVADLLWSTYLGLTLLQGSRTNLKTPLHPTKKELKTIFEMLARGLLGDSN